MEIFEDAEAWSDEFERGWLDHWKRTGKLDWKKYRYVRNREPGATPGVDLARARVLLVSTSGAFLRNEHAAFAAADPLGDYSLRTFGLATPFDALDYAHDHYDHAARREDPRVNLPLPYLVEMAATGEVGEMADQVVSFCGYQPDARAVVERVTPEVLRIAGEERADAALLVPV